MPLVTIVMPAYNVEKHIAKSIESVISQTEPDWELIIINDGSIDHTLDVITSFVERDCRISVISQQNSGVSAARNKGLQLATGKYISFLDADDIYDIHYISLMVAPLLAGEAEISFCKYKEVNGSQVISESPDTINTLVEDSFIRHILNVKNTHANMAMMYKVAHLKAHDICFLEGCANGEDRMFVLKSSYFANVAFVPHYLYNYIFREDSACRAEISYERFLAKLEGYLALARYFEDLPVKNDDHPHYLSYIETEVLGVKNNLRRKLWADLKRRNFSQVSNFLTAYETQYKTPFNVPHKGFKRVTNYFKMKVIQSNNPSLWSKLFR